jgi:large subunit ribosomal protein L18
MSYKKIFTVPLRRKRQGRTDYKLRLGFLKHKSLRLVVRKTNQHMLVQLVKYGVDGDSVVYSAHSRELKKFGWDINCANIPAAYLTGLLIGIRAKGKEAIVDLGLQIPRQGTKLYAAVKGASDGGLNVRYSEDIVPDEKRLMGEHISSYAKNLRKDKEKYEKTYSKYLKMSKEPEKIQEYFNNTKQKILNA